MGYRKPEMDIVEFEGYVYTSENEGLLNSNNITNDTDLPNHGGNTDVDGEIWD